MASQRDTLDRLWRRLSPLPAGPWLFSRILTMFVPYSGTIGAVVEHLEAGYCRTRLTDRRRVRNHLQSIHAVALVNLGEMTSGLAMTLALPRSVRGIVTAIGATYLKKARGTLTGEARVTVPDLTDGPVDHRVETAIMDAAGEEVCRVFTIWRLAARPADE
jgi:acyl-coenzyme A thioesterase PaaI-like protein